MSCRLFTLHKHHFQYLVKHFPLHAQALWVGNWVNVVGPYFRSWPHPRALKTRSVISRTLLYRRRVSLLRPFLLSKESSRSAQQHIIQRDKENAFSMIQCVYQTSESMEFNVSRLFNRMPTWWGFILLWSMGSVWSTSTSTVEACSSAWFRV